jgi:hypothetical protein
MIPVGIRYLFYVRMYLAVSVFKMMAHFLGQAVGTIVAIGLSFLVLSQFAWKSERVKDGFSKTSENPN